jgi:capsular polysaccharide biosynthesis protein
VTRLPSPLQPLWPLAKRIHRLGALASGALFRRLSPLFGARGLPRQGTARTILTAGAEPSTVTLHGSESGEHLRRPLPQGTPALHPAYSSIASFAVPPRFTAELVDGIVVGDYGATVTAGGVFDFETSPYFSIDDWREHPLFLRRRLPRIEQFDGTLLALATRGGGYSYYHFLFDVLPRYGIFAESMEGVAPDALYLPTTTSYQKQLLELTGLDRYPVVESGKKVAVQADRLLVPSASNPLEVAPRWMVDWVRKQLPAGDLSDKPRRIYVTRGGGRHTRRLESEAEAWPLLEERGFVKIDPGGMSVRDQIDHFAAADVIVGLHGGALTNLVFAQPGVKVLEVFAPTYVKHCFWAITDSIEGAEYRYLVADRPAIAPDDWLTSIQDDIDLDAETLIRAVDDLLGEG